MGHSTPGFVADVLDLVDDVVGVFFDGVVDAGKVAGFGAVVINSQSAADIEKFDADAQFFHLGIDAGNFDQGGLDLVDLGDLAADVRVQQLDASKHSLLFQHPDGGDDFRHAQAELGVFTAGGRPFAGPFGGEFYPDPQFGRDAGFFGNLDDLFQFKQFLDYQRDVVADFGGIQYRLDIFGILVAVADDRQVVAAGDRNSRHQFRF